MAVLSMEGLMNIHKELQKVIAGIEHYILLQTTISNEVIKWMQIFVLVTGAKKT